MNLSHRKWSGLFSMIVLVLLLPIQPAAAQVRPQMNILANWTPDQQLTSIVGDDRFVDLQLIVQGNVQFWAVDVACNIGRSGELTLVDFTLPESTWGTVGSDAFSVPDEGNLGALFSNGTLAFTATRIGASNTPVGENGADYSLLVATARFQVNDLDTNVSVAATCRTINFLNRDGQVVTRGRQTRVNNLDVLIGYTLEGTILRQGSRTHDNIEVTCEHLGTATILTTLTDRRGTFRFGGARNTSDIPNLLREFGLYECTYISKLNGIAEDTQFLQSRTLLNLTSPAQVLLPVVLGVGDFAQSNLIDLADLNAVTGAFGPSEAYGPGDANGDRRVDASDVAIVASNVDLNDTTPLLEEHVIYGLGRDFDPRELFPNSKIWWGTPQAGQANELINSRTRDFWPQVSPDGMEVAYVSVNARSGQHELFIGNTSRGRGAPFRFPRTFSDDILAPSWSPDGNRLAFICTTGANDQGFLFNEGDICLVNRDDRGGNTLVRLNVNTEIFPPAWLSYDADIGTAEIEQAFLLIYAENNQLKFYDLGTGATGSIPDTGVASDMPVVVNHFSGDSFLFYRFDNSGTNELRVALLEYDPASGFAALGAAGQTGGTTNPKHMIVDSSANVEYYDVSPLLDIMFYDSSFFDFNNLDYNGTNIIGAGGDNWASGTIHSVDSFIGNPNTVFFGGGLWNGDESLATELHAHRATFDWIP